VVEHLKVRRGDFDAAIAQAEVVLIEQFYTPPIQHVPLEPHVCLSIASDRQLTIHSTTQTPHVTRAQVAAIFGLPLANVRILVRTLGGGYGAKCYPRLEPVTTFLALKAGRPVKIVLTRAEEFVTTGRQAATFRLTTGALRDGTIVAHKAECFYGCGAYAETAPRVIRHGANGTNGAYRIPNVWLDVYAVYTNTVPCGPFRGPGSGQAHWARESHIDSLAHKLGMDPVAFRLKNVVHEGDSFILGGLLEEIRYTEQLSAVTQALDEGAAQRQTADGKDPLPAGEGPSPFPLPAGEGQGEGVPGPGAVSQHEGTPVSGGRPSAVGGPSVRIGRGYGLVMKTTNTPSTSTAMTRLNEDGSLSVMTASVEMGQGAQTALAQIAADEMSLPIERIHISLPDTETTPFDHSTSSSRTTFAMGTAIGMAIADVKQQLLQHAARILEVSPQDLEVAGGRVQVKGAPHRSLDYGEVVRKARQGNIVGKATYTTQAKPDPVTGGPGASAHYHTAAVGAEVAVDTETGRVTLLQCHSAIFAGKVINPTHCELQTEGSVFFGVGHALFEELAYDDGRVTNPNLSDYMIPSFQDVPDNTGVIVLEDPEHGEVHGVGETALPAAAPAIANAVFAATGVRVRDLPITPEKILKGLQEQTQ
jgi:CO/xanthine dehydrogenase Mo-binding subunit